jgi:hypothetical protein
MKLINSESSPVFTNISINPVSQILSDDRQMSRLCFIVHICPPIKQMTPLTHTFPIHFSKLMDFSRVNVFVLKNWITEHTSQLAGLVIGMVPFIKTVKQ